MQTSCGWNLNSVVLDLEVVCCVQELFSSDIRVGNAIMFGQ